MAGYAGNKTVSTMEQTMYESNPKFSPLPTTESDTLRELIMGFRPTQLIYVAAKLGLADQLQAGPQTPERLAKLVDAEPTALYRLLRTLASLGVFAERSDGSFMLTPSAQLLRTDVPGSLRSLAIYYGEEWVWKANGRMLSNVQTGVTAFEQAHIQPLYTYLEQHPAAAAQFQEAMATYSGLDATAILTAYDFSHFRTVVDVGGGHGALVLALIEAQPQLSGVLFDRTAVIARHYDYSPLLKSLLGQLVFLATFSPPFLLEEIYTCSKAYSTTGMTNLLYAFCVTVARQWRKQLGYW